MIRLNEWFVMQILISTAVGFGIGALFLVDVPGWISWCPNGLLGLLHAALHALPVILLLILLASLTIGLALQQRLFSRLRAEHAKALEILAESSAGIMAFQQYLWKRQYVGLHDPVFTRCADYLRRYWVGWLWFFLLVIVASVLAIMTKT